MATPAQQQSFFDKAYAFAQQVAAKTGISADVVFAQSALESNYGTQAPGNNYFGIKGNDQLLSTQEYSPSTGTTTTTQSFASYPSMGASFDAYANLINGSSRYKSVASAGSPSAQAAAMGATGYATSPSYTTALQGILSKLPSFKDSLAFLAGGTPATSAPVASQQATSDAASGDNSTLLGYLKNLLSFHTAARASAVVIGVLFIALAVAAFVLTSDPGKAFVSKVKGTVS